MSSFRTRYVFSISKCTLVALCLSGVVRAEPTAADKALAVRLFLDGQDLMGKAQIAEACAKFEESQRLDPGGGTLLNLAVCHEKQGRTATAWSEFVEALGIARRDRRESRIALAQERIAVLEANLSTITLVVSSEVNEPDLELRNDGAVVGRAAWGSAIPVDPGDHIVEATAPNRKAWKTVVSVGGEGRPRTVNVSVPALERQEPAVPAQATTSAVGSITGAALMTGATGAPAAPATPSQTDPGAPPPGGSTQRTLGYVSLGVGVAALATGTVFGVLAMNKKNESDDACVNQQCTPEGVEANEDAGRFADYATVGFGVGIATGILGTVLLLTDSPSPERTTAARTWSVVPVTTSNGARLDVTGRF
jgi:hypothetical protein